MTKEKNIVGSRIRECRKALGLSQEALAELLYMKKSTICKYENDQHDIPSSIIVELSKMLNTTPNYLLCGNESEEYWVEEMVRLFGRIKEPKYKELAKKQLELIASM